MSLLIKITVVSAVLLLFTACASSPVTKPARTASQEQVYIVNAGDTLSSIGRRYGVNSERLQSMNQIADPRTLAVGQRLIIPDGSMSPASAFIWPLAKLDVTSEFGSRNNRHKGIDLRAPKGSAIRASADGVVSFVGWQNGYGRVVILKHADNIQTFYAHNEKNWVKKGQRVTQGQVIASVGRSGNATGYHVHFEFVKGRQPLNPRHYVSM